MGTLHLVRGATGYEAKKGLRLRRDKPRAEQKQEASGDYSTPTHMAYLERPVSSSARQRSDPVPRRGRTRKRAVPKTVVAIPLTWIETRQQGTDSC